MNKPVTLPETAGEMPAIFEIMPEAALQQLWHDLIAHSRAVHDPDEQTELLNTICMVGNAMVQRRQAARRDG